MTFKPCAFVKTPLTYESLNSALIEANGLSSFIWICIWIWITLEATQEPKMMKTF